VLDATDAKGRPFVNPVYCPFHMLNDYQDYNVVLVDGVGGGWFLLFFKKKVS